MTSAHNKILKRTFDIIFSLFFIVFIYSWSAILIGLGIKLSSKGSILFRQPRIGQDGKSFQCYKFRTMHLNELDINTSKNDSRIFPFGVFLRKTNLDEFPQFINVLIGNMSIVGPRPYMISEDQMLNESLQDYGLRRLAKPGITGYAATKGFRGGTNDLEHMQERTNLDIQYIKIWSLGLDLKICFHTAMENFII